MIKVDLRRRDRETKELRVITVSDLNSIKRLSINGLDNQTQIELIKYKSQNTDIEIVYKIQKPTYEEVERAKQEITNNSQHNISSDIIEKWVYAHRYTKLVYWGKLTNKLKEKLQDVPVIIHIDPQKTSECLFDTVIDLEQSNITEYPAEIQTLAYNASKDIQNQLFNENTNMYQSRQYQKVNVINLKTTLDEMLMIWDINGNYRTGFSTQQDKVILPVIFAIIKGAESKKDYNKIYKKLTATESQIVCKTTEFNLIYTKTPIKTFSSYMIYENNKLKIDKLRTQECWCYGYLDSKVQELILSKTEALISKGYKLQDIMQVVLCLTARTIDLINSFDLTGVSPKIVINHIERVAFTVTDCIALQLLHEIGFDIVIMSPMGYISIENTLTEYTEYNAGNYLKDIDTVFSKLLKNFNV